MSAASSIEHSPLEFRPLLAPRRAALLAFLAPLACAALAAATSDWGAFERLENVTIDWRFGMRGVGAPRQDIVIVEIDDASRVALRGEGRFDLRAHLPAAIDRLAEAGCRVVALDVWLDEPGDPSVDVRLAQALNESNSVIAVTHSGGRLIRARRALAEAAGAEGSITVYSDPDGVLRRWPGRLYLDFVEPDGSRRRVPHFPLAIALIASMQDDPAAQIEWSDDAARLAGRSIRGGSLVDFRAPQGAGWRTLAFQDVVLGRFEAARLDGAFVLIGEGRETTDQFPMPLAPRTNAGLYYHANALAQWLDGRNLREWPGSVGRRRILCAAAAFTCGVFAWRCPDIRRRGRASGLLVSGAGPAIVLMGAWGACAIAAFSSGRVIPVAAPGAWMAVAAVTGLAANWVIVGVDARRLLERNHQIEALFGRCVSPQVMAALKAEPSRVLQTHVRDVSVLFCDLRGYTATTAELPPAAVAEMLNEYYDSIADAIFDQEGMLDKFVGDAVMAVFSAPFEQSDHAARAVRAAIDIKRRLGAFNAVRAARGAPPLICGIGVHSGAAAAGFIGSRERSNYTVVGTTVNLAARIQALADAGETLVSEATRARLPADLPARFWRTVAIRGATGTHRLYEVPPPEDLCAGVDEAEAGDGSGVDAAEDRAGK